MDTFGCFYHYPFDAAYPSRNLITYDDDGGGALTLQFRLTANLISGLKYVLVVTTTSPNIRGNFFVDVSGSSPIMLVDITPSINGSMRSNSKSTIPIVCFKPASTPANNNQFFFSLGLANETLTFRSSCLILLSSSSPVFTHPYSRRGSYWYYQTIQVTVSTAGTYAFISSSSIDTNGLLYNSSFNPSTPTQNLISADDDSGGGLEFLITARLEPGRRYVLVVSTTLPSRMRIVYINALGQSPINLTRLTPSIEIPASPASEWPIREKWQRRLCFVRIWCVQVHLWCCHPILAPCHQSAPCSIDLTVWRGNIIIRLFEWISRQVAHTLSQAIVWWTPTDICTTILPIPSVYMKTWLHQMMIVVVVGSFPWVRIWFRDRPMFWSSQP